MSQVQVLAVGGAAPLANFKAEAIQGAGRGWNPKCGVKTGGRITDAILDSDIPRGL